MKELKASKLNINKLELININQFKCGRVAWVLKKISNILMI